jgi:hypothetical protein
VTSCACRHSTPGVACGSITRCLQSPCNRLAAMKRRARLSHTWYAREAQASWLQMHALTTQSMCLLQVGAVHACPGCQAAAPSSTPHQPSQSAPTIAARQMCVAGKGEAPTNNNATRPHAPGRCMFQRRPLRSAVAACCHQPKQARVVPSITSQSGHHHIPNMSLLLPHGSAAAAAAAAAAAVARICSHRMRDFLSTPAVQKRSYAPSSSMRCANL